MSKLIYSKEYKDNLDESLNTCYSEDGEDPYKNVTGELIFQETENGLEIIFPSLRGPVAKRLECIPDAKRKKSSEGFVAKVKNFSQCYEVTSEIYDDLSSVSAWFYFTSGILRGEMKKAFVKLLDLVDEVSEVPHPKGREAWYDCAVILTYRTCCTTVDGQTLDLE